MIERECVRRMSDALRLGIPDADVDRLAAELSAQLEQMHRFGHLGLPDPPPEICFDARWNH